MFSPKVDLFYNKYKSIQAPLGLQRPCPREEKIIMKILVSSKK